LVIKTLDSELDPNPDLYQDPQLGKMLDPDPQSINADPQPCFLGENTRDLNRKQNTKRGMQEGLLLKSCLYWFILPKGLVLDKHWMMLFM
jgi:hypothetical protein